MFKRWLNPVGHEFARFVLAGAVNTLVSYVIFILLWGIAHWSAEMANFVSYVVGLCVSFFLNRFFVFKTDTGISSVTAIRFLLAFASAYALNLGVLVLLIKMGMQPEYAQIGAMVVYTLVFYVLNKRLVWR